MFIFFSVFAETGSKGKVRFYVFLSSQCDYCQDVLDTFIAPLSENYSIEYKIFDLSKKEDFEIFLSATSAYSKDSNDKVSVLIGDKYIGEKQIETDLEPLVDQYSRNGGIFYPVLQNQPLSNTIAEKLGSFNSAGVFCAGLLDGLNPCAFSTLIFFISYLLLLQFSRSLILKAGIIFIAVSFMVYFLIGIGLFKLLQELTVWKIFSNLLYKGTGMVLLVLALMSFYDAYLSSKGQANKNLLQLGIGQKTFIHRIIREKLKSRNVLWASGVIGLFISLAEFTCTGQIYLPTIMYTIKMKTDLLHSLLLLTIYNAAFILPLILVFIAVYKGLTDRILASYFQKQSWVIKLFSGFVFLVFSILLVI